MRSRIKVQWNLTSASWSHLSSKLAPHITFWVFMGHDTGPFSSLLRPVPWQPPWKCSSSVTWDIPNHGHSICWNSRRNCFETFWNNRNIKKMQQITAPQNAQNMHGPHSICPDTFYGLMLCKRLLEKHQTSSLMMSSWMNMKSTRVIPSMLLAASSVNFVSFLRITHPRNPVSAWHFRISPWNDRPWSPSPLWSCWCSPRCHDVTISIGNAHCQLSCLIIRYKHFY